MSSRPANVQIQGEGRVPNPRIDNDDDWNWYWFCTDCGVKSRRSSKARAEGWADFHNCEASTTEQGTLPWGDMPYDGKTPREVVDDYVLVRGDLAEGYARAQLASWIERYARAHVSRIKAEERERLGVLSDDELDATPTQDPTP